MKRWMIIAALVSLGLIGCDNSEGRGFSKEAKAILKQDDKKGKKKKDNKEEKKGGKKDKQKEDVSPAVAIVEQWEMPGVLTEVSGIAWYGSDKIAAVQDESGTVFIFNLRDKKIEKQIPFAGKGDYEGIAVAGNKFFVLRSDGTIIEVSDRNVKEYKTHLTASDDTEGLAYDKANNRLLVAVKAGDPSTPSKGIYSFDLSSLKMHLQPVMTIDLESPLLSDGKKISERFQPSEIAVHPSTGEIYLTDGGNPSLLVMSPDGRIKAVHKLDRSVLKQPEGITFSPSGDVYISSEGVKDNGVIVKVKISNVSEEEI